MNYRYMRTNGKLVQSVPRDCLWISLSVSSVQALDQVARIFLIGIYVIAKETTRLLHICMAGHGRTSKVKL